MISLIAGHMFKHYTEKARRVIFFALHEAKRAGAKYIEPEHILLSLLREERSFFQNIAGIRGFSVDAIRQKLAELPQGNYKSPDALPLSGNSRTVQKLARKVGKELQHSHIGPEHLLVALYRYQYSIAGKLLLEYGFSAEIILAWYA